MCEEKNLMSKVVISGLYPFKEEQMEPNHSNSRTMGVTTISPFLALTFGMTWGLALLVVLFTDQVVAIFGEIGYTNPLYILAVYSPALAAIFLVWRYYGIKGLGSYFLRLTLWRMPPGWWLFLVFGIPGLFYLSAAITGTITYPFSYDPWYTVLPALLIMLLLGPIEEFGWRGLALPLLQRRFTPLWSSLIIGSIWGVWHLPAFFIGGTPHSQWVFAEFFVGAIALSVIMTAMFNAARGSILTAALFHFQLNNPIWPDAQPWVTILFASAAVIVVLLNRRTMFTSKDAVTEVLMPSKDV